LSYHRADDPSSFPLFFLSGEEEEEGSSGAHFSREFKNEFPRE
jgi:hypothetical protein